MGSNPSKKIRTRLTGKVRELASKYIAEEIETDQYPRKQAIAIGISRAVAETKRTKKNRTAKRK